jgi:hypothetical protein
MIMKAFSLLTLVFFCCPLLVIAEDEIDVSGVEVKGEFFSDSEPSSKSKFEGDYDVVPELELEQPRQAKEISNYRQKSRFEEVRRVRESKPNRNPRAVTERSGIDTALDYNLHHQTGNDVKHGLDALQNINEALLMRQKRVEAPASTSNTPEF